MSADSALLADLDGLDCDLGLNTIPSQFKFYTVGVLLTIINIIGEIYLELRAVRSDAEVCKFMPYTHTEFVSPTKLSKYLTFTSEKYFSDYTITKTVILLWFHGVR